MTESDAKIFVDQGLLTLRGFLPRKLVMSAQAAIVSELERLKLKVDGKLSAPKLKKLPIFQQTGHLGQMIGKLDAVDRLFSEDLIAMMDSLAGRKLKASQPHSQILLSFPHKEEWSLNQLNWHLDLAVPKVDQIPGVQAFVLIDDLQARGGATLALAGSHKLHYVRHNENAHGILRTSSAFNSEPEKFLKPQILEGVSVQIIEMAGRAGDVFLMDLRVLHSPSVNSQRNIRMMATNRFLS